MAKVCTKCKGTIRKIHGSRKILVLHNNKEKKIRTYNCPHCGEFYGVDQYRRLVNIYEGA